MTDTLKTDYEIVAAAQNASGRMGSNAVPLFAYEKFAAHFDPAKVKQMLEEIDEQCRLNGMGAHRELKLQSQLDRAIEVIKDYMRVSEVTPKEFDQIRIVSTLVHDLQTTGTIASDFLKSVEGESK